MNALDKRAWELSNDIMLLNLNESFNPKLLKRQITKKNATNLNKSLFCYFAYHTHALKLITLCFFEQNKKLASFVASWVASKIASPILFLKKNYFDSFLIVVRSSKRDKGNAPAAEIKIYLKFDLKNYLHLIRKQK